eukprot:2625407-Pyramimonas_sp.AAC.1
MDIPGGGPDVAHNFFRKTPGRPLRGRWGSVAGVEKLIIDARTFIGAVFKKAFGKNEAGPAPLGKAKAKAKPKAAAAKAHARKKVRQGRRGRGGRVQAAAGRLEGDRGQDDGRLHVARH